MSGQNASQWVSNATLAFSQEGFQTEDLINETIDIGNNTATSNATLVYAQQGEGNATTSGRNATQGQIGGNMTRLTQGQTGMESDNGDEEEDDKDDKYDE